MKHTPLSLKELTRRRRLTRERTARYRARQAALNLVRLEVNIPKDMTINFELIRLLTGAESNEDLMREAIRIHISTVLSQSEKLLQVIKTDWPLIQDYLEVATRLRPGSPPITYNGKTRSYETWVKLSATYDKLMLKLKTLGHKNPAAALHQIYRLLCPR